MNYKYTKHFWDKTGIPNYQLTGFIGIFEVSKYLELSFHDDIVGNLNKGDEGGTSYPYRFNTILTDEFFSLSLSHNDVTDQDRMKGAEGQISEVYNKLFIYYIDEFRYPNVKLSDFQRKTNNAHIEFRKKCLAAIVLLDKSDYLYLFSGNEIFRLNYLTEDGLTQKPICSLKSLTAQADTYDISHYNSYNLGQSKYSDERYEASVVDYPSGDERARNRISDLSDKGLDGSLYVGANKVATL
jgi:hypothetical protein